MLYPTGSSPGKSYGTAKVHKLSINSTVEELPLRPYYIESKHCYVSDSKLFGQNIIPSEPFKIYCRK